MIHISDKTHIEISNKMTNNPTFLKWAKYLKRSVAKEAVQVAKKHIKRRST